MKTVEQQAIENMFICPESKRPLFYDGTKLTTDDGSISYSIADGKVFFYKDVFEESKSVMFSQYKNSNNFIEIIRRVLRRSLFSIVRSSKSRLAFHKFLRDTAGQFVLGVGGGPVRDFDSVNLNIGPWENVEIVGDAHNLPYLDNVVENISCLAVLEHLERPNLAIEEMYRVLKPGGLILIEVPGLQPYHGYPHHYQNYTITGLELAMKNIGFTLISSGPSMGPTSAMVSLFSEYLRQYMPLGIFIGPMFKGTIGFLLTRLDYFLANSPRAYILCGGVFFLGEKV
jgi:SAM-dependent methyltransferase